MQYLDAFNLWITKKKTLAQEKMSDHSKHRKLFANIKCHAAIKPYYLICKERTNFLFGDTMKHLQNHTQEIDKALQQTTRRSTMRTETANNKTAPNDITSVTEEESKPGTPDHTNTMGKMNLACAQQVYYALAMNMNPAVAFNTMRMHDELRTPNGVWNILSKEICANIILLRKAAFNQRTTPTMPEGIAQLGSNPSPQPTGHTYPTRSKSLPPQYSRKPNQMQSKDLSCNKHQDKDNDKQLFIEENNDAISFLLYNPVQFPMRTR